MTTSAAPTHPPAERTHRLLMLSCALVVAATYGTAFFLPVLGVFPDYMTGWDAFRAMAPHNAWDDRSWFNARGRLQALVMWLANPLLWVGMVLLALGRSSSAAALGLLALPAGLSAAFNIDTGGFHFHELHAGYYCWLASMAFLTAAGAYFALGPVFKGTFSKQSSWPDD